VAGVTVKALHHYDRVGLLQPPRTASRYRVHTATWQRVADFIEAAADAVPA